MEMNFFPLVLLLSVLKLSSGFSPAGADQQPKFLPQSVERQSRARPGAATGARLFRRHGRSAKPRWTPSKAVHQPNSQARKVIRKLQSLALLT
jgi:hypothetical protein